MKFHTIECSINEGVPLWKYLIKRPAAGARIRILHIIPHGRYTGTPLLTPSDMLSLPETETEPEDVSIRYRDNHPTELFVTALGSAPFLTTFKWEHIREERLFIRLPDLSGVWKALHICHPIDDLSINGDVGDSVSPFLSLDQAKLNLTALD